MFSLHNKRRVVKVLPLSMRQKHNVAKRCPILRLPPEIISTINRYVISDEETQASWTQAGNGQPYAQHMCLASICKALREIVIGDAKMWTYICLKSPSFVPILLERSKGAPLFVYIHASTPGSSIVDMAIDMIATHIDRIRALMVEPDLAWEDKASIFCRISVANRLRLPAADGSSLDLLPLQKLQVRNTLGIWESPFFLTTSLTHLTISECGRCSWELLSHVLLSHARLRCLQFESALPRWESSSSKGTEPTPPMVQLPSTLQRVLIRDYLPETTLFLSRVTFTVLPELFVVDGVHQGGSTSSGAVFDLVRRFTSKWLILQVPLTPIKLVELDHDLIHFRGYSSPSVAQPTFILKIEGAHQVDYPTLFKGLISTQEVVSCSIALPSPGNIWQHLPQLMPRVEHIVLEAHSPLHFADPDAHLGEVPFPALKYIDLYVENHSVLSFDSNALVAFVSHRARVERPLTELRFLYSGSDKAVLNYPKVRQAVTTLRGIGYTVSSKRYDRIMLGNEKEKYFRALFPHRQDAMEM
ncbi:hypothetical protein AX16_003901 [Volvariella volvacea WC 439]|nr:hypothetical protein AX16_003901 [Volvariella volvacea WC 439]